MADLYVDEDVSERLLAPLEARGHRPTSVGRLGHKGLSDARQLLIAADSGHLLVTHNAKDYRLLHEA